MWLWLPLLFNSHYTNAVPTVDLDFNQKMLFYLRHMLNNRVWPIILLSESRISNMGTFFFLLLWFHYFQQDSYFFSFIFMNVDTNGFPVSTDCNSYNKVIMRKSSFFFNTISSSGSKNFFFSVLLIRCHRLVPGHVFTLIGSGIKEK